VIIFGAANGTEPRRKGRAVTYEIPATGVLKVRAPAPPEGVYEVGYYYVSSNGTRERIPVEAGVESVQVFGRVDGVSVKGTETEGIRWVAYVVGAPTQRDDWVVLRDAAAHVAAGNVLWAP
jgi:hypothetical protein